MSKHQGRPRGSSFSRKEWVKLYKHLIGTGQICCAYCCEWKPDLGFGHLKPHSKGGQAKPYNLTITCQDCELIIGTKDMTNVLPSLLDDMQINYPDMYIKYIIAVLHNRDNTDYVHPDGL